MDEMGNVVGLFDEPKFKGETATQVQRNYSFPVSVS